MNLCVLRVEEHPSKVKLDCNVLDIHLHRVRVREIKEWMMLLVMKNTSSPRFWFTLRFQEDKVIIKHLDDGWHLC